MFVDVSAKSELNLDKLLEAIVLTADASLDLRANPEQDAQGLIVEAHLDRGRGPVATVLVQRGTLRVGDSIVAGPAHGRVRALLDEHNDFREEVFPGQPAMVLGLSAVPGAGQNFLVVEDDRMARQIAEKREARERAAMQAKRRVRRSLEDFMASMADLKGAMEGTFRIASIYSIGLTEMPRLREEFARVCPGVQLLVEFLRPNKVYDAVLSDHADIGFISYPEPNRDLTVIPWREEQMVVAAYPSHPFAGRTLPTKRSSRRSSLAPKPCGCSLG